MLRFLVALALLAFATQAQAGPVGPRFQVNTYKPGSQGAAAIAPLKKGGFIVTWVSDGQDGWGLGIYRQLFNATGSRVGIETRVNTTTVGNQLGSSVAALGDGGFVVAWRSVAGTSKRIVAQRFGTTNMPVGTEFRVDTTLADKSNPAVAGLLDGGFVVAWISGDIDGTVFAQRYTAAGVPAGAVVKVAVVKQPDFEAPAIIGLASGGFVVAWNSGALSGGGIFAQRYTAAGAAAGGRLTIRKKLNSFTTLQPPSLAPLKGGAFVAVWTENGVSRNDVLGQRYTADGVSAAPLFRTSTNINSFSSAVAGFATGAFVISFLQYNSHFDGRIYIRRYSATGLPLGLPLPVGEPLEGGDQVGPAVATLPDGFVTTWCEKEGSIFTVGEGVFGQRYSP